MGRARERVFSLSASIMLVAAMNPCPCGYYGDRSRECLCTPQQIWRYRSRLSGPLPDRLDLHVVVMLVPVPELGGTRQHQSSAAIRERVMARARQSTRYVDDGVHCNEPLKPRHVKKYCSIDSAGRELIERAMARLDSRPAPIRVSCALPERLPIWREPTVPRPLVWRKRFNIEALISLRRVMRMLNKALFTHLPGQPRRVRGGVGEIETFSSLLSARP